MKHLFFKSVLGTLLTGCTVSNLHMTSVELPPVAEIVLAERDQTRKAEIIVEKAVTSILPPSGNYSIRPECGVYVPLPVPNPIRIDFKELDAAATSKEINAIALRNVKELHQQLKNYASAQLRHYGDYKQRCVLK